MYQVCVHVQEPDSRRACSELYPDVLGLPCKREFSEPILCRSMHREAADQEESDYGTATFDKREHRSKHIDGPPYQSVQSSQ